MFKKILKWSLFILPFILGTIGLYISGTNFLDSMYYAFNMYFMNYGNTAPNILVEIARWVAPILLISGVVTAVKTFWNEIRKKKLILSEDAAALYCSEEKKEQYLGWIDHSVFAGNTVRNDAKHHILMLETDQENLELAAHITHGDVFIELKDTDSFLMKPTERHFFNVNEIIARHYWKKFHLVNEDVSSYSIGIVGYGALGKKLLKYGLMYNVYAADQKLSYHVYGTADNEFSGMDMMNGDTLSVHEAVDAGILQCDRVIFTEKVDVSLLEKLLYSSHDVQIYYHAAEPYLEKIYAGTQIHCYGHDVCTRENIMTNRLYAQAMRMNYNYLCLYDSSHYKKDAPDRDSLMAAEYSKLSGFLKGSNLASCDYNEIREKILERDGNPEIVQDDQYVRMEHIRWCRYYYVNHWRYGTPVNKQERDRLRIHNCLVPYDELSREDKDKDLETIRVAMSTSEK